MHRRRLLWQCKGLRPVDLGDGRDGDARHPHSFADLVLGGLPGRHLSPRDLGKAAATQLGLSRYETAWLILQKRRRAMVASEREFLKREVEIDEFWLGGCEEGLKGSRQRGKKALVGVAIEVRGAGSGRLRLAVLGNPCSLPRAGQARLSAPPPSAGERCTRRASAAPRAPGSSCPSLARTLIGMVVASVPTRVLALVMDAPTRPRPGAGCPSTSPSPLGCAPTPRCSTSTVVDHLPVVEALPHPARPDHADAKA